MKITVFIIMCIALMSCASMALNQNIRNSEMRSVSRIKSTGITDGAFIQKLKFVGTKKGGNKNSLVYSLILGECDLYVVIPKSPENGDIVITDKDLDINKIDSHSDITIVFSKVAPNEIVLRDLSGSEPMMYVNVVDGKGWSSNSSNKWEEYETLRGTAIGIDDAKLRRWEIRQDLKTETSVRLATVAKSFGYFVTVPFDIITSPIQGIWFVYAIGTSMPH
jgi:hypothetical protein